MSADDLNEMSEETLAVEAKKTSDKKKRLELSVGDRIVYVTQFGEQIKGKVRSVITENGDRVYNVLYDNEFSAAGLRWSNRYLFKEGDVIPEDILKECSMDEEEEACTTEDDEEIPVLEREHLCANVDDVIEDDDVEVGMKRRASSEDDEDYPVLKRQLSSAE